MFRVSGRGQPVHLSSSNYELLLENRSRPADPLPFQVDINFDAVGNLNEGDASVHPIVLAIDICESEFLGFRDAAKFKRLRPDVARKKSRLKSRTSCAS
jgi:hypothetical protein